MIDYFDGEKWIPIDGGGGEVTGNWELIWENPNQSAAFAAQTISADVTPYKAIFARANFTNTDNTIGSCVYIPLVDAVKGSRYQSAFVAVGTSYIYYRSFRVNAALDGFNFTTGFRGTSTGTGYCIPRDIWGLR